MRALDLFCGAGGATRGLQMAGFHVTGIDIKRQPRYCGDAFIQADALNPPVDLAAFDLIWASPPCQAHVQWNNLNAERYGYRVEHPDFIAETRELLDKSKRSYILENVIGSPLHTTVMLCGSMFGLGVRRHRNFECSFITLANGCAHNGSEIAIYGKLDGRRIWTRVDGSEVRAARTLEQARAAMGIDWMDWIEIKEAIPPAYSEYIAREWLRQARQPR